MYSSSKISRGIRGKEETSPTERIRRERRENANRRMGSGLIGSGAEELREKRFQSKQKNVTRTENKLTAKG